MGLNKIIAIIGLTVFFVQSISSASIGSLNDACLCTREYFPVCGSDDVTYSNTCVFECAKRQEKSDIEIKFYGECDDELKPQVEDLQDIQQCVCKLIYDPVCGSDGQTYASECEFNCAKRFNKVLETSTKGECIKVETLPMEQPEKMQKVDACVCTFNYEPVCGSDGITYSNECELNCAKRINKALNVFTKGECVKVETLPMEKVEKLQDPTACRCTRIFMPICGTDGNTYSNECMFSCAKKIKKHLNIKSMGEC